MLIHEVSKLTGLTKKAIEYDVERGLISPSVSENGYRDFSPADVERLSEISVLRKLGADTDEIESVLTDETGDALQALSVKKELHLQRERAKKSVLDKLSGGRSYSEILPELEVIERSKTITEKLLEAFPGYYGRFVCLHFARFLNEPIQTERQLQAYEKIIAFLDSMPPLSLPGDLQKYLLESADGIGTAQITEMIENTKKSIENPDDFLASHKELLEQYLAYQQSEEYRNSPACRLKSYFKEFNSTSGYYDRFIPALKELSPSYAEYQKQLEAANEKFLAEYPDMANRSTL